MVNQFLNSNISTSNGFKYICGSILSISIGLCVYFYSGSIAGDDTFIYMRYVNNLNNGSGFVYNLNEKSFGTTSILWPLIMFPVTKIFGNQVETWKLFASLLVVIKAFILFIFFLYLNIEVKNSSFLTTFSFLEPHTFRWLSSGMENSIAILLFTIVAILFLRYCSESSLQKNKGWLLGVFAGILPFARPEFAIVSLCIIIFCMLKLSHSVKPLIISFFLTSLLFVAITFLISGFIIPQTGEAKAISLFQGHSYVISQTTKIILSGSFGAILLLFFLIIRKSKFNYWYIITLISIAITILYLVKTGQLVSTRYAIIFCSPLVLNASLAIFETLNKKFSLQIKIAIFIQSVLFILILILVFPSTRLSEENDIKVVADYSIRNLPNYARVALTEIGAYGFFSNFYIVDIIGLVDTSTLNWIKKYGRPDNQKRLEELLIYRKATHYINCFSEKEEIEGEKLKFQLLKTFQVTRNNLSFGVPLKNYWRIYKIIQK